MNQQTIDCNGQIITHNDIPWCVKTNRHRNTDGTLWGWIAGAPGNICWANNKTFNFERACSVVEEHNLWLEEKKLK